MQNYRTRHLEATREIPREKLIRQGERFYASDTDAEYYIARNQATEVRDAATPATPATQEAPQATPRPAAEPKPEPRAEALVPVDPAPIKRRTSKPAAEPRAETEAPPPKGQTGFVSFADLNPAEQADASATSDGKPAE